MPVATTHTTNLIPKIYQSEHMLPILDINQIKTNITLYFSQKTEKIYELKRSLIPLFIARSVAFSLSQRYGTMCECYVACGFLSCWFQVVSHGLSVVQRLIIDSLQQQTLKHHVRYIQRPTALARRPPTSVIASGKIAEAASVL